MYSRIALRAASRNRVSSVMPRPSVTAEYSDAVLVSKMYWARWAVNKWPDQSANGFVIDEVGIEDRRHRVPNERNTKHDAERC